MKSKYLAFKHGVLLIGFIILLIEMPADAWALGATVYGFLWWLVAMYDSWRNP